MAQSLVQWVVGYVLLIVDLLTQKFHVRGLPKHDIFRSSTYLAGRTAVVTGANSGIGLETARLLHQAGADVILACRNLDKARWAQTEIQSGARRANGALEVMQLDLSDMESVRAFGAEFDIAGRQRRAVHMLVLNGGVMGVDKRIPEQHLMTNHVGHALLTLLLLPALTRAKGRVVFVSSKTVEVSDLHLSDLHFRNRPYNWMTAYANSKLMMLLFMRALLRRLRRLAKQTSKSESDACNVVVMNAVHPGDAPSQVSRHLGPLWSWLHRNVGPLLLLSARQCAWTVVHAAGAREHDGSGEMLERVGRTMQLGTHLVNEADEELAWRATLELAGLSGVPRCLQ